MIEFLKQTENFFLEMGSLGLGLLAFIESSFFPVPPDLLLIAMSLSLPQKALIFALICTIGSTLGGAFGYFIGKFGGRPIFYKIFGQKSQHLNKVEHLYSKYGTWAVLTAAFTPIPYKVFTIASGIFSLNFIGFMIASFIGRGFRFFIVGISLMLFGEVIKDYLEFIIIGVSLLIVIFFALVFIKRKN